MKRGGPLRRRTPLQPGAPLQGGAPLRRTPLQPGSSQLARTPLQPGQGMRRTRSAAEMQAAALWAPTGSERCAVCGQPGTAANPLEGHHVLPRAKLLAWCAAQVAQHHLDDGQAAALRARVVWDMRNRLPVHQQRHAQHTSGSRPLPARTVSSACRAFAAELGMDWYLDKHYQGA